MKNISFLIFISILFPSDNIVQNGKDWESWAFVRKVGYVNGFLDGFNTYEVFTNFKSLFAKYIDICKP